MLIKYRLHLWIACISIPRKGVAMSYMRCATKVPMHLSTSVHTNLPSMPSRDHDHTGIIIVVHRLVLRSTAPPAKSGAHTCTSETSTGSRMRKTEQIVHHDTSSNKGTMQKAATNDNEAAAIHRKDNVTKRMLYCASHQHQARQRHKADTSYRETLRPLTSSQEAHHTTTPAVYTHVHVIAQQACIWINFRNSASPTP